MSDVVNAGGRIQLELGKEVRYLTLEGILSDLIYTIDQPHTDTWAKASLRNGDSVLNVYYKRILDKDLYGKAIAIPGDKEVLAVCPKCKLTNKVSLGQFSIPCCNVEVFFMSEAVATAKQEEANVFDLNALKSKYEVWVKSGKFNDSISLQTVQLVLLDGEDPRKFSFNLYNGKLNTGSKSDGLRLEEFDTGVPAEGKSKFWYAIKDKTKYATKLEKDGYVKL